MAGPLTGIRIIEVAGIGPGPFCAMMLADMGAEVVRVDRAQNVRPIGAPSGDVMARGRRNVALDLKNPDAVETFLQLVEHADGLIEGFRPGVMERLGIGPEACAARNPKLVFGRMTGWGQEGPYAQAAGHDINYIALSGTLAHIGRVGEAPVPPLNLVGDFGGGGMLLAYGMVCGLLEASRSGVGQVVDAAMVDGAAVLMAMFWGMRGAAWDENTRGVNLLDTGSHFYDAYECADGAYISLGSIEPQFYAELIDKAGLADDPDFADRSKQMDKAGWTHKKERLRALFRTRTRAEWCSIMEMTDICFAPVLTMAEAAEHPHNKARSTFVEFAGKTQPAPAPRFSRTAPTLEQPPAHAGEHTREVLTDWGIPADRVEALLASGAAKAAS
jgi:alpha-methylacyl-CoA racemase